MYAGGAGTKRDRNRFEEGGHGGQQDEEDKALGQGSDLSRVKVVTALDIRRWPQWP